MLLACNCPHTSPAPHTEQLVIDVLVVHGAMLRLQVLRLKAEGLETVTLNSPMRELASALLVVSRLLKFLALSSVLSREGNSWLVCASSDCTARIDVGRRMRYWSKISSCSLTQKDLSRPDGCMVIA